MNEKKTFYQEAKEWWQDNKKVVKTGVICGLIGLSYGFVKGVTTMAKMVVSNSIKYEPDKTELPCDDLGLTDANCDDPELFELVDVVDLKVENS